jgi:predicted nucleotidyltransferase
MARNEPIDPARIVEAMLAHYPAAQGIYLFGSHATVTAWPNSDVDVAVLLPPDEAERAGNLALSPARAALEEALRREVDLLNARLVSTVMQKELIYGELLYCGDRYAVDEFEMLTLSDYQRLNEERREIIKAFVREWPMGKA